MSNLPSKMTGKDLVVQETYEASIERKIFNGMDRVDRRDKRNHIVSMPTDKKYREHYEKINWSSD